MSILFNPSFYLAQNSDVLAAVARGETTAAQHFDTFGRFEGRNPNAFFDVNFYLLNNTDVLDAGVNPLTHFLQFGALEGRLPSTLFPSAADFDTDAYAAANPDLAAAGITTPEALFAHFVTFGFAENRPGVQALDGTPIVVGAPGTPGTPGETFTLTTAIGENIVGTNANDTFQAIADVGGVGAGETFNSFDTINGGGGTDTLNLLVTSAGATIRGTTSNVEIINIIADAPGDGVASVNAARFQGAEQIWQVEAVAANVTNLGAGTAAGFRDMDATADVTAANGASTITIALDEVDNGSTLTLLETTADDVGAVTVVGSTEDAGTLNLDLTGLSEVDTLNLSLTSETTVAVASGTLETIDASGSAGDLTIDATGLGTVETLIGGAGADTLTTAGGDETVIGGAGADVINITGGGVTTVVINAGDTGITAATADEINGFAAGAAGDVLDFGLAAASATNFVVDTATSFAVALSAANTLMDGTIQYAVLEVAGDSWVFVDRDLNGLSDEVVQLAGTTGLTIDNIIG